MEPTATESPIFGDRYFEPNVVPFAPTIRVLAQVRWPNLANHEVRLANLKQAIEEALGDEYPRHEEMQEAQFLMGPGGIMPQAPTGALTHRFMSARADWTLTLAGTAVTLETSSYSRRRDFLERFTRVLATIEESGQIPVVSRVGYRYTNRIDDDARAGKWAHAVTPALLGYRGLPLTDRVVGLQASGEALMAIEGRHLMARWALLPPNVVLEPSIPPSERASWVLDLDSFSERQDEFSSAFVLAEVDFLTKNAFQFFSAVVDGERIETESVGT